MPCRGGDKASIYILRFWAHTHECTCPCAIKLSLTHRNHTLMCAMLSAALLAKPAVGSGDEQVSMKSSQNDSPPNFKRGILKGESFEEQQA